MKKNILPAAILAGLVGFSFVSANAATISSSRSIGWRYTDFNNGVLQITKFDSSLGTLTGVEISFGANVSSVITATNVSSDLGSSGTAKTEVYVTLNDPSNLLADDQPQIDINTKLLAYSLDIGAHTSSTKTGSGSSDLVYMTAPVLSEFSGVGAQFLNLGVSTSTHIWTDNTGGNTIGTQVTQTTENVTVTYTYTAAPPSLVPEPTTWAMLVGGVGMLVATQRMRRRSA